MSANLETARNDVRKVKLVFGGFDKKCEIR